MQLLWYNGISVMWTLPKIFSLQNPFLPQVHMHFCFLIQFRSRKCSGFIFVWNNDNKTAMDATAKHGVWYWLYGNIQNCVLSFVITLQQQNCHGRYCKAWSMIPALWKHSKPCSEFCDIKWDVNVVGLCKWDQLKTYRKRLSARTEQDIS